MSVATVRSRIISFYAEITKWRLSKFFFRKMKFFFSDFSVNKSSKKSKFLHNPRSNSSHTCAEYVYEIS